MMKGASRVSRWLSPKPYPGFLLFLALCAVSVAFAWLSYNLVMVAMSNVDFLRRHGLMAVAEGGLVQLLVISGKGMAAMLAYLAFRVIESELVHRWAGREEPD